jgi:hypothetical protein
VACSGWMIPVRADLDCELSDLIRSGCTRSSSTSSISDLLQVIGSGSNGQR